MQKPPGTLRRATGDDVGTLVDLRALMFVSMGTDVDADPWREAAAEWFELHLDDPSVGVFVVEDPTDGVVSCAVGTCSAGMPGPERLSGVQGRIANVCTFPAHRGNGYARLCVTATLDWFAAETDAGSVDLNATPDGRDLYRTLGFAPPRYEFLQRPAVLAGSRS